MRPAIDLLRKLKANRSARIAFLLLISSAFCATLALLGLHYTDQLQKARAEERLNNERKGRLEEAARAWAIQHTLQRIAARDDDSPPVDPKVRERWLEEAFGEARTALGLKEPEAATGTETRTQEEKKLDTSKLDQYISSLKKYLFAEDTQLHATLLAIVRQGAVALVAISILCLLAILLILLWNKLIDIALKQAEGTFKVPEPNRPGPAQPPSMGFLSLAWLGRQPLVPTLVGAGVLFTIGTILVNAGGREISVTPDLRHNPKVGLAVDDFSVAVHPGKIDIPATSILPSEPPQMGVDLPSSLVFSFPASRIEQEALTALTQELREYRSALEYLATHDQSLAQQRDQLLRLARDNQELQTQLALLPTQTEIRNLKARIDEQVELGEQIEKNLVATERTLGETLPPLLESSERTRNGDRVAARQFTRSLTTQNNRLFNRLFRRGLIKKNCETLAAMAEDFDFVRGCPETTRLADSDSTGN